MGACLSREDELHRLRITVEHLKDGALQERFMCKVCFDEILSHVFLPCGHCIVCGTCSLKMMYCPVCTRKITKRVQIHYP